MAPLKLQKEYITINFYVFCNIYITTSTPTAASLAVCTIHWGHNSTVRMF